MKQLRSMMLFITGLIVVGTGPCIGATLGGDTPDSPPKAPAEATKLAQLALPAGVTIDEKGATIDQTNGQNLVNMLLLGAAQPLAVKSDDHFVIHIVHWKNVIDEKKNVTGEFGVAKEIWYVYRAGKWKKDQFEGARILGKSRVVVLSVYYGRFIDKAGANINAWTQVFSTWSNKYELGVKARIPTPIQHLLDLLGAISPLGAGMPPPPIGYAWSAALFTKIDTPSTLTLNANVDAVSLDGEDETKVLTQTFENEGRYLFDFSVGLPVRGVQELQYGASDNVVRTREVTRQNAYGFLNLFFRPQDVSSDSIFREPHLVLGVPISGKPLDRPVIGLGMGLAK